MNFEIFNHPYTLPIGAVIAVCTFTISGFTAWNDVKSDIRNNQTVQDQRHEAYLHHEREDEQARAAVAAQMELNKREIRGDIRELRNLIMIPPDKRSAAVRQNGFDRAEDPSLHGQK